MGISSDIMHDFVLQEIKRIYSGYDGWKITPGKKGTGYDTFFHLSRRVNGEPETANIFVTFKKEVSPEIIPDLMTSEFSPYGGRVNPKVAIIAPRGADTTGLSGGIKIFTMVLFAFDGDNLIWVKKPVCQSPDTTGKPATGQTA
jgi:hypothetical protein